LQQTGIGGRHMLCAFYQYSSHFDVNEMKAVAKITLMGTSFLLCDVM